MVFMVEGGFHDGNSSHWWYQKHPSFTIQTFSYNINWGTAAVHMSVAKNSIRKAIVKVNAPLECWGCTNSPIYHTDGLHTYRKFPNRMDPDMAEHANISI